MRSFLEMTLADGGTNFVGLFLIGWVLLIFWSLFWKGWALWISARQNHKIWFGALLVINTVGILEILYIFFFSKSKEVPNTPIDPELKK